MGLMGLDPAYPVGRRVAWRGGSKSVPTVAATSSYLYCPDGDTEMGGTYNVLVSCRNCMLELAIPISKGRLLNQVDWGKKPCPNCGTCELDPATIRPCTFRR